ncbi:MAG: hypothetical protein A2219_08680 [Elusimicrobia bacterium RIFOXYA2_FULL_50_26]|nr:MAG: hypothetical protein A2219_08680 [Elusimicrobia bacterium RIFOXYA2_FULL_50_26]OGS25140.1 MAG: hypothetical protein A2314_02755 [Elusimicrobia bacterium RIFOXYB2_FULL_50_12]
MHSSAKKPKEEKEMKRSIKLAVAVLAVATLASRIVCAETSVATNNISASASITAVNTLTTELLKIADNTLSAALAFGNVSSGGTAWNTLPESYVKVTVQDNSVAWRLRIYSDNYDTAPSTAVYGYSYGGLRGDVTGSKVPMAWLNNTTLIAGGPAVGNPVVGTTNGWIFLKDEKDVDDPLLADDQSFIGSDAVGYTNIAFGAASYTRIVRPNVTGLSEELTTPTAPFYLYTEGDFSSAPAATYTGTIKLELLNQ